MTRVAPGCMHALRMASHPIWYTSSRTMGCISSAPPSSEIENSICRGAAYSSQARRSPSARSFPSTVESKRMKSAPALFDGLAQPSRQLAKNLVGAILSSGGIERTVGDELARLGYLEKSADESLQRSACARRVSRQNGLSSMTRSDECVIGEAGSTGGSQAQPPISEKALFGRNKEAPRLERHCLDGPTHHRDCRLSCEMREPRAECFDRQRELAAVHQAIRMRAVQPVLQVNLLWG